MSIVRLSPSHSTDQGVHRRYGTRVAVVLGVVVKFVKCAKEALRLAFATIGRVLARRRDEVLLASRQQVFHQPVHLRGYLQEARLDLETTMGMMLGVG